MEGSSDSSSSSGSSYTYATVETGETASPSSESFDAMHKAEVEWEEEEKKEEEKEKARARASLTALYAHPPRNGRKYKSRREWVAREKRRVRIPPRVGRKRSTWTAAEWKKYRARRRDEEDGLGEHWEDGYESYSDTNGDRGVRRKTRNLPESYERRFYAQSWDEKKLLRRIFCLLLLQVGVVAAVVGVFYAVNSVSTFAADESSWLFFVNLGILGFILLTWTICVPYVVVVSHIMFSLFTLLAGSAMGFAAAVYDTPLIFQGLIAAAALLVVLILVSFNRKMRFSLVSGLSWVVLNALAFAVFFRAFYPETGSRLAFFTVFASMFGFTFYAITNAFYQIHNYTSEDYFSATEDIYLDIIRIVIYSMDACFQCICPPADLVHQNRSRSVTSPSYSNSRRGRGKRSGNRSGSGSWSGGGGGDEMAFADTYCFDGCYYCRCWRGVGGVEVSDPDIFDDMGVCSSMCTSCGTCDPSFVCDSSLARGCSNCDVWTAPSCSTRCTASCNCCDLSFCDSVCSDPSGALQPVAECLDCCCSAGAHILCVAGGALLEMDAPPEGPPEDGEDPEDGGDGEHGEHGKDDEEDSLSSMASASTVSAGSASASSSSA